ncbi:YfiR family protein [Vibrio sp. Sgm 22]|uniref:YfiR family protein n=1 Tax=unclassified Vibrio TaxID=2614977 RepID=UPI00224960F8|nr:MULTISPECIES: YfiR family protein [unclassified Vibrio]MCX2757249.1 YfiR family protein [Vibrio sp. 14G-20]MCX2774209.1 YfiR family protein [Vibrio sp. Sgm 22]
MNSKWLKHRVKLSLSKLGFAALIMLIVPLNTSAASIKPYEIKAMYLFRIANFIRWDDESSMNTVNFCVIGDKKVSQVLTSITEGKSIRSLVIQVQQSNTSKCDITYLSDHENDQFRSQEHSPHTVTISDIPNFTDLGGVIELTNIDNKLKAKINLDNARRGDYVIGANLLRIAIVEGQ